MEYFVIGKIVNTHGVQGLVRAISYSDDPMRFFELNEVILSLNGKDQILKIEKATGHKQFILLKLAGIDNMDAALGLKGGILKLSQGLTLDKDEYYIKDIYDCQVYEESGEYLGIVNDIIFTGANDVYVLKHEGRKDLLIPAIKQCIKEVDIEKKRIVISLMEGLRD